HLVLAIEAQHGAGLAIGGAEAFELATHADAAAGGIEAGVEVLDFTRRTLQSREEAGDRVGVMPDVGAGADAAAHALPAPEPPVPPASAGGRRENRRVQERAIQKPVRQRRVVPRVVPEARLAGE